MRRRRTGAAIAIAGFPEDYMLQWLSGIVNLTAKEVINK